MNPTTNPTATPPQSDPAMAAAEAIVYHNPDNLPSPGEAPWRFLVKGEEAQNGDEAWEGSDWFTVRGKLQIETEASWTYRTMRPLPLAPAPAPCNLETLRTALADKKAQEATAPAPEGRGETAQCTCADWGSMDHTRDCPAYTGPNPITSKDWQEIAQQWQTKASEYQRERNSAVAQAQALREAVTKTVAALKKWEDFPHVIMPHCDKCAKVSDDAMRLSTEALTVATAALAASEAGK